jgi:NTP pyrophosphatase (non-canonical NTP hydrolase)
MNISFKDYFKYRNSMKISEMSAEPAVYTDKKGTKKKQEEIRKTPIFFDQEDIDYLNQFPPRFWKKALTLRYGKFLKEAWDKVSKGQKVEDVMDVEIRDRGRNLVFPKIKVNINNLYEKLTEDVDDQGYSQLTPDKKDEFLQSQSRSKMRGTYGMVLTNFQRDERLGVSEGFVELKESIAKKRLSSLLRAIQQGWYTRAPAGSDRIEPDRPKAKIKFGGSDLGTKTLPIHTPQEALQKFRGYSHVKVRPDGQLTWTAIDKKSSGKSSTVSFTSHLPVLKPAMMISSESFKTFQKNIKNMRRIKSDVESQNVEDYLRLMNPQTEKLVSDKIEEIKRFLDENKESENDKDLNSRIQRKRKDLDRLELTKSFANKVKKMVSKLLDPATISNIPRQIESLEDKIKEDPQNQQVYRMHIQNLNKTKEIIDFLRKNGASTQRPEVVLRNKKVLSVMLAKLHSDLQIQSLRLQTDSKRHDVHDWNMHQFNPNLRKFHTRMRGFGTFNPNWQQAEAVHGALQRSGIDPDEFWKEMSQYLISVQDLEDDAENPRVKKVGGNEDEFENTGALADGINSFLKSSKVYGTPVYYAMVKNWWQIFENASDHLQKLVGSRYFLQFLPKYKEFVRKRKSGNSEVARSAWQDPELKQAFEVMKFGAKRAGQNYAQMVFQLKKRMGKSAENLANILLFPNQNPERLIQTITQKPAWNRTIRQEDPSLHRHGQHGLSSHNIQILQTLLNDRDVNSLIDSQSSLAQRMANSFSSSSREQEMVNNIVQTGMAFVIFRTLYMALMQKVGQQVNLEEANGFAGKIIDVWMKKKGIRQYRGQIKPSERASQVSGQRNRAEESQIRQRLQQSLNSSFGYTPEEAQELLDMLQSDENSRKAQELLDYISAMRDPATLLRLSNHREALRKLEDKVRRRDLGWKVLEKLLKAVQEIRSSSDAPRDN